MAASEPPSKPEWLPAAASAFWDRTAPQLAALGLLTPQDGPHFTALCLAWSELIWATSTIEAEGHVVTLPNGQRRVHPAHKVMSEASRQIASLASEFGMTPAARARIGMGTPTPPEPPDAFEQFLQSNKARLEDFRLG